MLAMASGLDLGVLGANETYKHSRMETFLRDIVKTYWDMAIGIWWVDTPLHASRYV